MNSTTKMNANDFFANTAHIISKFPYPNGAGTTLGEGEQLEEISGFATEGDGCLQHLLAMVSDCLYHYELDDDFHDNDMKMAYLVMKKAWESGGDTKPFFSIVARNRKALNWTHIALIWLMVLDRNEDYWTKAIARNEMPEQLSEERKEKIAKFMEYLAKFRKEWKELHEAERIASISIGFKPSGWSVALYGKKTTATDGNETDDPTA